MSSSFDLEVASRLPLADAAFRLLGYATEDDFLQGVFDRHRGRSFNRAISFPVFVHLVTDALLGHAGSAHSTFGQAQANKTLPASIQAMYAKLRRVPINLSLALFTETAARLRTVASPLIANPLPPSLASFRLLAFDGKKLKYVAKRLKPLRRLKGNIFGGKLLVVQDLATQQAVAAAAVPDGEAADNPLVADAVMRVRAMPDPQPRLWVADRAFCEYQTLGLLADREYFVVRYRSNCLFYCDPSVQARTGKDEQDRPYQEEWGWLGKPNAARRIPVRKITVFRKDAEAFSIVTNLMDADRYPAVDLLMLYRHRWGIETMFQQVVQTFDLRHLIGSTPQATVFQAMLCLLLYNTTLIIRDYVAQGAKQEPKKVSPKRLFDAMVRELISWRKVIGVEATIEMLQSIPVSGPEELRRFLQEKLGTIYTDLWQKSPTRKRPPKQPRAYLCGGHSSVDKILRGKHREIPLKPDKNKSPKTKANPPPMHTKKQV
jgi:hypothetical protein